MTCRITQPEKWKERVASIFYFDVGAPIVVTGTLIASLQLLLGFGGHTFLLVHIHVNVNRYSKCI